MLIIDFNFDVDDAAHGACVNKLKPERLCIDSTNCLFHYPRSPFCMGKGGVQPRDAPRTCSFLAGCDLKAYDIPAQVIQL